MKTLKGELSLIINPVNRHSNLLPDHRYMRSMRREYAARRLAGVLPHPQASPITTGKEKRKCINQFQPFLTIQLNACSRNIRRITGSGARQDHTCVRQGAIMCRKTQVARMHVYQARSVSVPPHLLKTIFPSPLGAEQPDCWINPEGCLGFRRCRSLPRRKVPASAPRSAPSCLAISSQFSGPQSWPRRFSSSRSA